MNTTRPDHPVVALIDELVRLNGRLKSLFSTAYADSGLSSMEFTVLTAICSANTPPTVPQIGRSLGHARQVIQRAANLLVGQNLVETVDNPNHKRAPLLRPTAKGAELKQKVDKRAEADADKLLARMDRDRCNRAADDLHALRLEIEDWIRTGRR